MFMFVYSNICTDDRMHKIEMIVDAKGANINHSSTPAKSIFHHTETHNILEASGDEHKTHWSGQLHL